MTLPAQEALAGRESITVPATPDSVGVARAWFAARCGPLDPGRREELVLIVSELVTNAIRHGVDAGDIDIAATPKDEFLCVQITDRGAGFAPRPGAMASDDHGGFGLFLVERLTRRWGMTREQRRTRVWFEFDYDSP